MSLTCECDIGPEAGEVYHYPPEDYSVLQTSKRKRCCSCKDLIDVGSVVGVFERSKVPGNDVEEAIYGEGGEIPRANWYMCEECTDLYFNLSALEFCMFLGVPMKEMMQEYIDTYQPPKIGGNNGQ